MSNLFDPPQDLHSAATSLENLSALIAFVNDLTTQGGPKEEYSLSSQGQWGFSLFLGFVDEQVRGCMEAYYNNIPTERR